MPYKVQFTPITSTKLASQQVVLTNRLSSLLKRDLADEAERIINELRAYPGEVHHEFSAAHNRAIVRHFVKTGQLQIRTRRGFTLQYSRRGAFQGRTIEEPQSGEYVRTGLLGLSWTYDVKDRAGSVTLVFDNTAHDRPGNYYAGWVHGPLKNEARAGAKYHQAAWHNVNGWPVFLAVLGKTDIRKAVQDTINDYLAELGLEVLK